MPYYWLVAIVVAMIFIADTVLYGFWGAKLDANELTYAARPKDVFANLPIWASLLAMALAAAVVFHYYRRQRHATPKSLSAPRSRLSSLLFFPLVGLLFLGMRGGVRESSANPADAYFSPMPISRHTLSVTMPPSIPYSTSCIPFSRGMTLSMNSTTALTTKFVPCLAMPTYRTMH